MWFQGKTLTIMIKSNYPKIAHISRGLTEKKSEISLKNTPSDLYDAGAKFEFIMESIVYNPRLM